MNEETRQSLRESMDDTGAENQKDIRKLWASNAEQKARLDAQDQLQKTISEQLGDLNTRLSDITRLLHEKIDSTVQRWNDNSRTNWGTITAAITGGVSIISVVGILAMRPIQQRQAEYHDDFDAVRKALIDHMLADNTDVVNQRVDDMERTLTRELGQRREWMLKLDKEQTDLGNRIRANEVRTGQNLRHAERLQTLFDWKQRTIP